MVGDSGLGKIAAASPVDSVGMAIRNQSQIKREQHRFPGAALIDLRAGG